MCLDIFDYVCINLTLLGFKKIPNDFPTQLLIFKSLRFVLYSNSIFEKRTVRKVIKAQIYHDIHVYDEGEEYKKHHYKLQCVKLNL